MSVDIQSGEPNATGLHRVPGMLVVRTWDVMEARLVTARAQDLLREASRHLERLGSDVEVPGDVSKSLGTTADAVAVALRAITDARRALAT